VTSLFWFTRNLRIHDHPALRAALDRSERVVPVFCLDDRLLRGRHASGGSCPGSPARRARRPSPATGSEARVHRVRAALKRAAQGVDDRHMSIEVTNGLPEGLDQTVTLELSLAEAEAVKSWLLKPAADGSAAIDDENAKSVMVKLGAKLDFIEGVARVRDELEQAGFPTDTLSDEQVADLGRRIAESPIRRYSGSPS
jgi:hypothetical protein